MTSSGFNRERTALAERLAVLTNLRASDIEHAMVLQNESYLPHKRNMVAVLALVAQLTALAADLDQSGGRDWWNQAGADGRTPLARLKSGEVSNVCGDLIDRRAGPYDVPWDQQWPPDVARRHLRDAMPAGARPGDLLTADEGGARMKLRVIQMSDGTLTAEPLADTWVDPPFEDVYLETYRRLAREYPNEIPPLA